MDTSSTLSQLGWKSFFQQQLSLHEWESQDMARVIEVNRSNFVVLTKQQTKLRIDNNINIPALAVGDWILLNNKGQFLRRLERSSLFTRKAAGKKVQTQLIAANIDTVFIVCSLNQDFNLNRIERYLALANEAGVEAVVVLTKLDCCDDPEPLIQQVRTLDSLLMVEAVNSLDPQSVQVLEPWCRQGNTVAFLGSSGVGKSTLLNTLLGCTTQPTAGIRKGDVKGRHTTTARTLHFLATGGILLDTPGMRELQLADCEQGIEATFNDVTSLASSCRFSDCQHETEPGCAVQQAIMEGRLQARRLNNYLKLLREQQINTETLAQKRARDRSLGQYYRSVKKDAKHRKKGSE